ncbi:MAG: type I-D CRISPR-associated protein Cas5/Csc1 [Trueperaceae bacterium]|nr:type I-D CRISPR-associated protein Cas5/Csc1 [Trueperaceae bacterium]
MLAYHLEIYLHDLMYYASRELGRMYISERYIHNYALTYALGLAHSSYHDQVQVPKYQEELEGLNEAGIYVTPAKPVNITTSTHTFKFADTRYQVKMEQSSVNIPTFGRIREINPESQYEAFVFSSTQLELPKWIRLGKWMSKSEVKTKAVDITEGNKPFTTHHPLNGLDLPIQAQLYDLINMPPVSLVDNARFEGEFYSLNLGDKESKVFPKGLRYIF